MGGEGEKRKWMIENRSEGHGAVKGRFEWSVKRRQN